MPHDPKVHWKRIVGDLNSTIEAERAAALEWRAVAQGRLDLILGFDAALTRIVQKAASIEQVLNVGAPEVKVPQAPSGSSAEEAARLCKTKLHAIVNFTENLAREALRVETTLNDVFGLAQQALQTARPTVDMRPSKLAQEFRDDFWPSDSDSEQSDTASEDESSNRVHEVPDGVDSAGPVTIRDPANPDPTDWVAYFGKPGS